MERFSRFERHNHEPFLKPLEPVSQTWKEFLGIFWFSSNFSTYLYIQYTKKGSFLEPSLGQSRLGWLRVALDHLVRARWTAPVSRNNRIRETGRTVLALFGM